MGGGGAVVTGAVAAGADVAGGNLGAAVAVVAVVAWVLDALVDFLPEFAADTMMMRITAATPRPMMPFFRYQGCFRASPPAA